jgi:hypothetical protein
MYASNSNRVGQDTSHRNSPTTGLGAPREVGEIGQQAQRLEHLATRLDPILHSPSPTAQDTLGSGPRDTEMAQFLHEQNDRILNLAARVEDMLARIAL